MSAALSFRRGRAARAAWSAMQSYARTAAEAYREELKRTLKATNAKDVALLTGLPLGVVRVAWHAAEAIMLGDARGWVMRAAREALRAVVWAGPPRFDPAALAAGEGRDTDEDAAA